MCIRPLASVFVLAETGFLEGCCFMERPGILVRDFTATDSSLAPSLICSSNVRRLEGIFDLRGTEYSKNPITRPYEMRARSKHRWLSPNAAIASRPNSIGFSPDHPVRFYNPMYSRRGEAPINTTVNPETIKTHPARKGFSLSVSFFQRT